MFYFSIHVAFSLLVSPKVKYYHKNVWPLPAYYEQEIWFINFLTYYICVMLSHLIIWLNCWGRQSFEQRPHTAMWKFKSFREVSLHIR